MADDHPQINVRAPKDARATLLRIGGHLRTDPAFLAKLDAFLNHYEGKADLPDLPDRLAQIEARLAALEAGR